MPLDEIAVLFRSSFHSFDLELELARPTCRSSSAAASSSSRPRTSRTCSRTCACVANPRDAVSWHRVLLLLEGSGRRPPSDDRARTSATPSHRRRGRALARYPRRGAYTKELARLAELLRRRRAPTTPPAERAGRAGARATTSRCSRHVHPRRLSRSARRTSSTSLTIAARYREPRVAAHRHGARAADRQRRRRPRRRGATRAC